MPYGWVFPFRYSYSSVERKFAIVKTVMSFTIKYIYIYVFNLSLFLRFLESNTREITCFEKH